MFIIPDWTKFSDEVGNCNIEGKMTLDMFLDYVITIKISKSIKNLPTDLKSYILIRIDNQIKRDITRSGIINIQDNQVCCESSDKLNATLDEETKMSTFNGLLISDKFIIDTNQDLNLLYKIYILFTQWIGDIFGVFFLGYFIELNSNIKDFDIIPTVTERKYNLYIDEINDKILDIVLKFEILEISRD